MQTNSHSRVARLNKIKRQINQKKKTRRDLKIDVESIETEGFETEVRSFAERSGKRFLFEFPAVLINEDATSAAAILQTGKKGLFLSFIVYFSANNRIEELTAQDVPKQLSQFTWSFAQVISHLSHTNDKAMQ